MGVRENKVETYLHSEVKKLGGMTYKWTGRPGVPDRIVFLNGNVYFREIKTSDGKLSSQQVREIARIRSHGGDADVIYGRDGVDEFISNVNT